MGSESVKNVRIRISQTPNETESLSLSVLSVPGHGKLLFAEKVRKMYSNQDPQELEIKIEQLWKGLSPSQREKFIGSSGEKENIKVKSDLTSVKSIVPVLERRNNCKAIARVLDLKATRPMTPYSELVKNRMKAVWKDGSLNSKRIRVTPTSPLSCSITMQTPPPSPPNRGYSNNHIEPIQNQGVQFVNKEIPKASVQIPSVKNSVPQRKSITKSGTKTIVVKKPQKPKTLSVPKITYEVACQEYYKTLSQSFLINYGSIDTTMLPAYANIMEGRQPVREYSYGASL